MQRCENIEEPRADFTVPPNSSTSLHVKRVDDLLTAGIFGMLLFPLLFSPSNRKKNTIICRYIKEGPKSWKPQYALPRVTQDVCFIELQCCSSVGDFGVCGTVPKSLDSYFLII